ncbi:ubiquitin-protein ligase E3B isoform X2 [Leptidea sinapis]|uniref:ubiquitin-protein ligase E3B isoform X2 n=1 Tax=Leptidea sinapis TaxID=189913 RepID=UPI0021C311F5|nr:ubiquitin-protein ligase E3B isoform X2 [Leptidea sinapis]
MFSKNLTTKDSFLEQMKAAREERALEKKREESAIKIQSIVRGWLARQRFISLILEEFDNLLPDTNHGSQDEGQSEFVQALDVYKVACRLFLVFKQKRDSKRFERLCKYIVHSLHSESVKISYVGVFLNKDYSLRWIAHIKDLLFKCCQYLEQLKPEYPADMQSILIHLHTLLEFTATNTWAITRLKNFDKLRGGLTQLCANVMGSLFHRGYYLTLKSLLLRGLCREKVNLKNISLSAVIALALRPLISAQFSEKLLTMFIIQILSVPTLVYQMNQISPESISTFRTHALFDKCVEFLSADQNMRIVFNTLEGNYALCLLGNLVQLAYIDRDYAQTDTFYPTFVLVVTRFLDSCQQYVVCKKGNLSNWHPVLGWFSQSFDAYLPPTMTNLRVQLSLLWGVPLLKRMLGDPLKEMLDAGVCDDAGPSQPSTPVQINNPAAFIWRAIESRTNRANSSKSYRKLGSAESTKIALICAMYHTALQTMTQVKLDILTGK